MAVQETSESVETRTALQHEKILLLSEYPPLPKVMDAGIYIYIVFK